MFKKMDLFSKTCIKILFLLSEHPSKSFYEKEMAVRCKISTGAVNTSMNMLKSSNLVTYERKGKSSLYKINLNNFVAREIKVLSMIFNIRDLIENLKTLSKKIILFGSCANGTDVEESDVDLFILSSENKEKILRLVSKAESSIARKINPIVIDPKNMNIFMQNHLYKNIQKGKVLWDENES